MSRASLPAEQENELDQYLVQDDEGWAHGFLTEQAQRAPWWTISFLLHCLVLVVMWRLPARVQAVTEKWEPSVVKLVPWDEMEDPREPKPPVPPPEIPDDTRVPPVKEALVSQPGTTEVRLGDPSEPKLTDMPEPTVESPFESMEPPAPTIVFAVHVPGKGPKRGDFSHRIGSWGKKDGVRDGTQERLTTWLGPALDWLATAQERDGRWSCRNWGGSGDHDVGMTGLALLAYLGRGYSHMRGPYKTTILRGLNWLAANQKSSGSFGWTTFYEQGIAAMAVAEAYGMTRVPRLGRMAQAAINYIVAEQPEHGGFRYKGATTENDGDTSVTGWQIMAIKSALMADLKVPDQAVERCRVFLRNVRRDYGRSSYLVGQPGASVTNSAIAMSCKQFIGGDEFHDEIQACGQYLLQNCRVGQGRDHLIGDLYFTYYSTLGMFQMGGEYWYRWQKAHFEPLLASQVKTESFDERGRPLLGSWDPARHAWGSRGGRVYTTAMAILALEVRHRHLRIYRPNI
jgi:hypothetical protein